MGTAGTLYEEPGADFTTLRPDRARRKAIRQLEAIGYRVVLDNGPETP